MNNRRSPASKPKDFKKAIINLFGYCKDYYRLIIFAIVLSSSRIDPFVIM